MDEIRVGTFGVDLALFFLGAFEGSIRFDSELEYPFVFIKLRPCWYGHHGPLLSVAFPQTFKIKKNEPRNRLLNIANRNLYIRFSSNRTI